MGQCKIKSIIQTAILTVMTLWLSGLLGLSALATETYQMLDNVPFNARARGVVGGLGVDSRGVKSASGFSLRLSRAIAAQEAKLRPGHQRLIQLLRRNGLLRPGQRLGLDAIAVGVPQRPSGSLLRRPWRFGRLSRLNRLAPRQAGAWGAGDLQFRFQGFEPGLEQRIRAFLQRTMPLLKQVYGAPVSRPPGSVRTVTIVQDEMLDALDGGVYAPEIEQIRIPAFLERNWDFFNLIHQVFHAFHGPLVLSFPAWEEGMARAAAIVAYHRINPDFDPSVGDDPLFLLPLYDYLNQPPLGNNKFLPSPAFQLMAVFRVGMSAAAWLKVAAENPQFFRSFNSRYYEQVNSQPELPGDVPALKELVRTDVPKVEGLNFLDWFRRQFALDNSISAGLKVYVFNVPQEIGVLLNILYYRTDASGNETPLNGLAELIYSNDESDDLFAEEGNEAEIVDGEGSIAPQFFNIGGANRIRVAIWVENLFASVTFPYMVRGPEERENPLWGAVVGADDGSLTVRTQVGGSLEDSVNRGVFAITQGVDLGTFQKLTVEYQQPGAPLVTEQRNAIFGFYALLIHARPQSQRVTKTFRRGTNGFHLMTVPILPFASDEAEALGIPAERLLLARWRPTLPGENKYEIYPRISAPMGPGVGYWLRVDNDVTVTIEGVAAPTDEPFPLPLAAGWNQLGNPFLFSLPVFNFRVSLGDSEPVDLLTAEQNGWIQQTVWIWDQQNGFSAATTVEPWAGFFIKALRPDGLTLWIMP